MALSIIQYITILYTVLQWWWKNINQNLNRKKPKKQNDIVTIVEIKECVVMALYCMSWNMQGAILTHWGRVTHICVSELIIIGSDNGLSPGRRQAIIWTNDGILLIGPLGTNFSEILFRIQTFSFNKMHLKMSSAKWRPFCLGPNVLTFKIPFYQYRIPMTKIKMVSWPSYMYHCNP